MPQTWADTSEQWAPVLGYEGLYEASSAGRVRSVRDGTNRLLRPWFSGSRKSYLTVGLSRNGNRIKKTVHRAVLEAFSGPPPEGLEARHLNDDPMDNRVENLTWGTRRQNMGDAISNGHTLPGSRNPSAKLTDTEVVFRMRYQGMTQEAIGTELGVHQSEVSRILSGKRWGRAPEVATCPL